MGSIFLAAKVEECPCRMTDLVNEIDHLTKHFRRKTLEPLALFSQVRSEVHMRKRHLKGGANATYSPLTFYVLCCRGSMI